MPLIIFGGTFDPIHNGHLRCALEIAEYFALPVTLMPTGLPGHRHSPVGSPEFRCELIATAIADYDQLRLDRREIERPETSYTIDTLLELRALDRVRPIIVATGADSFASLDRWHRWQELLDHAHFLRVSRPGTTVDQNFSPTLTSALQGRQTQDRQALLNQPAGLVHQITPTPLDISATAVRRILSAGRDPGFLVPDAVRGRLLSSKSPYQ